MRPNRVPLPGPFETVAVTEPPGAIDVVFSEIELPFETVTIALRRDQVDPV